MKKRTYRAVPAKEFGWDRLAEQPLDRLVVGLDIAKKVMFATLMTAEKKIVGVLKWDHLSASRWVVSRLAALPVASLEVAQEPSGTYGDALREAITDSGIEVFRVQPKHVKDSRELYDGVPSNHDAKSSAIIAWLHLLGRSEPWQMPNERQRTLRAAVRTLDLYDQAFRQAQNRLEAQLARHWPEMLELLELDSTTLLELLARYGSPRKVAQHARAAPELMRRAGGPGLSEEKIQQIQKAAGSTLGVRMVEAERAALRELAAEARRRQKAVQAARRRLKALARQEPTTAQVGAVVGLVTATVLDSELGSLSGYPNTGSLIKAAGLNLKELSSGQHQGQLAISKRGPRRVRQYLYLAVLRWTYADPIAHAWYAKKIQRDGGRLKRKALIALMRKLLRGLWWVARGETFNSRKLFDTKRLELALAQP